MELRSDTEKVIRAYDLAALVGAYGGVTTWRALGAARRIAQAVSTYSCPVQTADVLRLFCLEPDVPALHVDQLSYASA